MKRTGSLRTALLYPLLWLWVIPAIIATLTAFWFAGQATDTSFDRVLKDDALALAAQVHWNGGRPSFSADSATAASLVFDSLSPSRFVVRTESGETLVGNAEFPAPAARRLASAKKGEPVFFDVTTSWGVLRTVALQLTHPGAPGKVWVIVGEAKSKRDQISQELAAAIFLPAACVGFLIVPLLYIGIRYGLAPARDISDAVARRSIEDLSPLPLEDTPDELRGFVTKINDLLGRLAEAIVHERHFIAQAAHQLRTPAAGIKLLAEDLLRSHRANPLAPPDTEVLQELAAASDRASHVVQQLLAMARAEFPAASQQTLTANLKDVINDEGKRWKKVAESFRKRLIVDVTLAGGHPPRATIQPTLFEEALGNVIENAIRYGGETISLELQGNENEVLVHVWDDGSPLSTTEVASLFIPFWRGESAASSGSGLGLAIARKAARSMQGELTYSIDPVRRGNRFTFHFSRAIDNA